MFEYKYKNVKSNNDTTYGSICIKNVIFEPSEIEKELSNIIFDDNNLRHMFAENDLNDFRRRNIYKRFIPRDQKPEDMVKYVDKSIKGNVNFYSFLAEGILGLVYRDLYGYHLSKGVIDVTDTVFDTHTGVDACMYSIENSIIILGEAKFYEVLSKGINQIICDFTSDKIKNKLESLQVAAENNENSSQIIIKNIETDNYNELTIEEFVKQKLVFAGFVLHSENNINNYANDDFYDKYSISVKSLCDGICKSLKINDLNVKYEIVLVHLPVNSKKSLIVKTIQTAQTMLKNMEK